MTSSNPITSSTNLFRRLTWGSKITLCITLSNETQHKNGGGIDKYFMQVPRYTYLPLLIPEIRENFIDLALDEQGLEGIDESQWWFEEQVDETASFAQQGPCKWHWPIDLIDLHSTISHLHSPHLQKQHLDLILHLSSPPTDKLLLSNTLEGCKNQFINSLKEADFVKWRNTGKVTSLRKVDLDAGWDGIVQDDYDTYMRMASRLLPLPIPLPTSKQTQAVSTLPRANSTDPTSSGPGNTKPDSTYAVKALPVKMYLPDGAPVVQEVILPLNGSGKPQTLLNILQEHLPLLFPPSSSLSKPTPTPSISTPTPTQARHASSVHYPLAVPLIQGVEIPPDAELAWLAGCLCGVDGWLRIGIQLRAE